MVEKNKQFVEWAMSNDCPFDVKITPSFTGKGKRAERQ